MSHSSTEPKTTSLYTNLGISQNNDETYILPVVQITFSNEARRIAVNCILDTGIKDLTFLATLPIWNQAKDK